jgi:hypothetical protein
MTLKYQIYRLFVNECPLLYRLLEELDKIKELKFNKLSAELQIGTDQLDQPETYAQ